MHAEILVLRILHIGGAILWAGTALFMSFFLMPALGQAGPAAGPVMGALVKRRVFVVVPGIAVITMLAGLRMLWLTSLGFSAEYFASPIGQTYLAGTVLSLVAFAVFWTVNRPAMAEIMQLGPQIAQAPDAEKGALTARLDAARARAARGSQIIAGCLLVTIVAMSVARYLG